MTTRTKRLYVLVLAVLVIAGAAFLLSERHDRAATHRGPPAEERDRGAGRQAESGDVAAKDPSDAEAAEQAPQARTVTVQGLVVGSDPELPSDVIVEVHTQAFPQAQLASLAVDAGGKFQQTLEIAGEQLVLVASSAAASLRSHPKPVVVSDGEVHAILQLVASGRVRLRVVRADGAPVAGGLALVTDLPQATFRKNFEPWEMAAIGNILDRVLPCGPRGDLTVAVREGHVVVRVADPGRGLFGRPHRVFVPRDGLADLGDLAVPERAKSFVLKFRDETGPVAAFVRLDERSYRFGHPAAVGDMHHLRAGPDGRVALTVPEEACPIRAAAFSPRHAPLGFELRASDDAELDLVLRRRPARELVVLTESGGPLPVDVQWIIEPVHKKPAPARSETQPLRAYQALKSDWAVLPREGAGAYVAVARTPGRYTLRGLVSGGVGVQATVDLGLEAAAPRVLRVPDGRTVELQIVAADAASTRFDWRIAWRASARPTVATEHRARLGETLPPMWVPTACNILEVTEPSGILQAEARVEATTGSRMQIEVAIPSDAARIRLVPTAADGTPARLKEVSVLLSGPMDTPRSDLRGYTTDRNGVVERIVRPGRYRAALYPLTRAIAWTEFEVAPGAVKQVTLSIR
jgi:hypothetical protein